MKRVMVLLLIVLVPMAVYTIWDLTKAKPINVVLGNAETLDEEVVWQYIQEWRLENDYPVYIEDATLCKIAGKRSVESILNFSHEGFQGGKDKYYEMTGASGMGENLGTVYNEREMVDKWLNSPTHLENLEDPRFTHACIRCSGYNCAHIFGAYQ